LERLLKGALEKCETLDDTSECYTALRRAFDSALDLGFMANHVLAYLMHIADVLSLASLTAGGVICCPEFQRPLQELAVEYMRTQPAVQAAGLQLPEVKARPIRRFNLKHPVDVLDPDAELLLLDGSADVQRKIKRAFCEPGNVDNCPPLLLAQAVVLPYSASKQLVVRRRAEDGGDLVIVDGEVLRETFCSGGLHPGDFKPAVRDALDELLKRVREAISADKALGAAEKELQKVAKRIATKGGGNKGKK
jgi:hypothetical protein